MPLHCTEGFLTLDSFRLISVASLGSIWVAIEAKFNEEFKFLGFMRYFSARFQQSSKMSKIEPKNAILDGFLKIAEKYYYYFQSMVLILGQILVYGTSECS